MQTHSQHSCFKADEAWAILSDIEQSIKQKVEIIGIPLKDWNIEIYRGVLTGYNDAFIISSETREEILDNCKSPNERQRTEEIIRPILRGRDIRRYSYQWADLWLINTHNGIKGELDRVHIEDYPAIRHHIEQYWDRVEKRADQGDTPYNLRNCAYLDLLSQPKIIWGEISDKSKFCIDIHGEYVPEATTFMLSGKELPYLLAFLNCSVSEYLFSIIGTTTGVGTVRWKKYKILELPVPKSIPDDLYSQLLEVCNQTIQSGYDDSLEYNINSIIYQVYGLTAEEIEFIESKLYPSKSSSL